MYSIETLFENLRSQMDSEKVSVEPRIAPQFSTGILPRIRNARWASRLQADVFHITGDIHYVACGLPYDRTILTIHDLQLLERLTGWQRTLAKWLWFDMPIKRSKYITAISEATKGEIIRLIDVAPERITVIPDTVAEVFQPVPQEFRSGCPRILQIGAGANKNVPRLVAALQGLSCHLHIVGHPSEDTLKTISAAGISHSIDSNLSDDEIFRAYCECDMVSFVSTYEGFGMPILEAQWVERPVVTSNLSSMPEVAGDGAIYVDPFDVTDIRRGFMQVIENVGARDEVIRKGRINRSRFTNRSVAEMYMRLYERVFVESDSRNGISS